MVTSWPVLAVQVEGKMRKPRDIGDYWRAGLIHLVTALVVALGTAQASSAQETANKPAVKATEGGKKGTEKKKETQDQKDVKKEDVKKEDVKKEDVKKKDGEAKKDDEAKPKEPSGEKQQPKSEFLRIERKGKKPIAMQTSIVRYEPTDKSEFQATVDLIGAVHVGEPEYYTELNKRFRDYDAVLFELVAPEGFEVPKGEKLESKSGVGAIQNVLKDVLGLQFQLDRIDYSVKNFVHADMSPEEFSKSMKDRGESFLKMFFRMMGQSMAVQSKKSNSSSDIQLMFALLRRDQVTVKRIFAVQFEDMESTVSAFNGPDGSTIITERNKKALEVLTRELKNKKKKVAIFYGAGHLPDMEERLIKDFGLKKGQVEWLTAWDLTKAPAK
jgi:hypothetical protein